MKRLRKWWRTRTWEPELDTMLMVSRKHRLPLVKCNAKGFRTAAAFNRRRADQLEKQRNGRPGREAGIIWNRQAGNLLERVAEELSKRQGSGAALTFEELPRRRRQHYARELGGLGTGG